MTIATQIQALNDGLLDAYTAVSAKGGTVPAAKNLDNLPDAIGSISGGGSPWPTGKSQYGRVYYYKNIESYIPKTDGSGIYHCTIALDDAEKFTNFLNENPPMMPGRLSLSYDGSSWMYDGSVYVDPVNDMGLIITITGNYPSIDTTYSAKGKDMVAEDLNSLAAINGLCTDWGQNVTINGVSVPRALVVDFVWGQNTPTTIGDNFMSAGGDMMMGESTEKMSWNSLSIPDTVTTIGQNFASGVAAPNAKIVAGPNLTSVSFNFLSDSLFYSFESNTRIAFENYAFDKCAAHHIKVSISGDVNNAFCRNADFNYYDITLDQGVGIYDEFLAYSSCNGTSNDPTNPLTSHIRNLEDITRIGYSFMEDATTNIESITLNSCTWIEAGFLTNCSGVTKLSINSYVTHWGDICTGIKTLSEFCFNPPVLGQYPGNNSFTYKSSSTGAVADRGVLLTGTHASGLKDHLPDITTGSNLRKLVV